MKIYTKTGDNGTTGLFGGKRVNKNDLRIDAYGTIDELNSMLGVTDTEVKTAEIKEEINIIQNELFVVGSDLSSPVSSEPKKFDVPRINDSHIERIEKRIDYFQDQLPELKSFILPGGNKGASLLHLSRSICRRSERKIAALSQNENIGNFILKFVNRLSDFLFVLARFENFKTDTPEVKWKK
jgi:cob(I)alamin adenosyltransferase